MFKTVLCIIIFIIILVFVLKPGERKYYIGEFKGKILYDNKVPQIDMNIISVNIYETLKWGKDAILIKNNRYVKIRKKINEAPETFLECEIVKSYFYNMKSKIEGEFLVVNTFYDLIMFIVALFLGCAAYIIPYLTFKLALEIRKLSYMQQ